MLVTLRTAPRSGAPTEWEAPEAEDALAEEGFRLLAARSGDAPAGQLGARLGALLDASHAAGLRGREPVATDRIVDGARAAGALGARALSSRAMLAAVATADLKTVRRAILAGCAEQPESSLGARFLTTAGVAGAGQGSGAVEGIDRIER
jgi:hypothetical protein